MPDWLITVIVGVIAVSGGWFTARVTGQNAKYSRIRDLEARVDLVEKRNVLQWNYNRTLINHIYEGKPPPPPAMPDGLV